jgi:hypothetical protein
VIVSAAAVNIEHEKARTNPKATNAITLNFILMAFFSLLNKSQDADERASLAVQYLHWFSTRNVHDTPYLDTFGSAKMAQELRLWPLPPSLVLLDIPASQNNIQI